MSHMSHQRRNMTTEIRTESLQVEVRMYQNHYLRGVLEFLSVSK